MSEVPVGSDLCPWCPLSFSFCAFWYLSSPHLCQTVERPPVGQRQTLRRHYGLQRTGLLCFPSHMVCVSSSSGEEKLHTQKVEFMPYSALHPSTQHSAWSKGSDPKCCNGNVDWQNSHACEPRLGSYSGRCIFEIRQDFGGPSALLGRA